MRRTTGEPPGEHTEERERLGYGRAVPEATPSCGPRWARRDLLRLGLAVPVLAGCSGRPPVAPVPTTSGASVPISPGAASPAPAPTVPAAATAEQNLSAYAGAILTGPHRADLSREYRTLLTFLRDAHAQHAVALAGDDPTGRPTTAAPSPTANAPDLAKTSLGGSLKRLARLESAQATAQGRAARSASGLGSLLAGSLSVAAGRYAAAVRSDDPPSVASARAPKPAPVLTDVAAAQQLVAQLHAVVYGYQLAIGKLKYSSGARKRAVDELAAARQVLDVQIAFLLGRKADVPAAEPAYVPSPNPRSPNDAGRLVRGMQSRLEPYAGLLLAGAQTPAARTSALTFLGGTVRTAQSWGAGLQVWPGWPD